MDEISVDREDLREWREDVFATAERLQTQRQRCNDIHRDGMKDLRKTRNALLKETVEFIKDPPTTIQDRMIQACNAAFSATLAFEMNRLRNDLNVIDPELASILFSQASECFGSDAGSPAYYARIMNNIL